jgi:hypothetical protein
MTQIIETVTHFLNEDQWPYSLFQDDPSLLRVGFQGKNGQWSCYARAREEMGQVLFYSVCPVNVPEDKRLTMAEFITRANFGLVIGNFEMNFDNGEVRYKTSLDVEAESPNLATLRHLIYANVFTMDEYLPGIMSIIYANVPATMAVAQVEKRAPALVGQPPVANGHRS